MLGLSWLIKHLIREKKSSEVVIDLTTFNRNESKIITVWSWRHMKTVKYAIHYEEGKFIITSLE